MVRKGDEKCQRCGEVGEDRRTLHHACFYAMDELGLPFDEYQIEGEICHKVGTKSEKVSWSKQPWKTTVFKKPTGKKENIGTHKYFVLRVCKDCRALWMQAIRDWFENGPKEKEPVNSGIFIRRNGANVEISEEEWYRLNPGKEPFRVVGPSGAERG